MLAVSGGVLRARRQCNCQPRAFWRNVAYWSRLTERGSGRSADTCRVGGGSPVVPYPAERDFYQSGLACALIRSLAAAGETTPRGALLSAALPAS